MPYAYDDDAEPLVYVRLDGLLVGEDVRRLLSDLDGLLARERDFGLIVDCDELDESAHAKVEAVFEWLKRNFNAANSWLRGVAFVTSSEMLLGSLVNAIQQRVPMPMPFNHVATRAEAKAWIEAKLDPSRSGRYRILT